MLYTDAATSNNDWLITPQLMLSGNQQLSFWTRVQSATEPDQLEVLLSTTGKNPADFTTTLLANTSLTNTAYQLRTLDLGTYSGPVYIAFVRRLPPADGYRLYIDDVTIGSKTPCSTPANLLASNGGILTCAQTSLTLTATGGNAYRFTGPGIVSQNASAGTAVVHASGVYSVTVTNTVTGCSSVTTATISSNTLAPAAVLTVSNGGTLTCAQTRLTLTATPAGAGMYGFTGPGLSQNGLDNTATANQAGSYSVVVTGANGCTASVMATVVSNTVIPVATLTSSGTLTCANTSVTLTASGGSSYSFSAGAVQTGSGNQAVVTVGGVYSVTVANANGCINSASVMVLSNTNAPTNVSLTPAVGGGTLTCANTSVTLTANSTGGTSYTFSTGAVRIGTTNQAVVNVAGVYSVTIANASGCSVTATATVTSNTIAPTATLTASSPAVCSPATITLTAGGGSAYTFSTGATQVGSTSQAIVTQSGTYAVTVSNASGCTATASVSVTVNSPPAAPTLTGASQIVTQSNTPLPLNQFVNATEGNTFSFSGVNGLLNPPNADVSQTGVQNFSVTQTNSQGCVSNNAVFSITVQPGSTTTLNSQTVCRSSDLTLVAGSSGSRYEWYRNGQTIANRLSEIANVYRGTKTGSLTLVNIQAPGTFYCKVFAANGSFTWDGPYTVLVDFGCTAPGARQAAPIGALTQAAEVPLSVLLTPNPVTDGQLRAVVRGATGQPLSVQLLDLQGQVVQQQQWPPAESSQVVAWNVSHLPAGVYLLRAQTPGQVRISKVIKQ